MQQFKVLEDQYKFIPSELQQLDCWINWRLEKKIDPETKKVKYTKIPYQTNGWLAKTDNLKTWNDFKTVVDHSHRYDGIGFVFSLDTPYTAIDIDHCIDEKGIVSEEAKKWVNKFNSYTEISQSGTGLHIIVKSNKIELYSIFKDYNLDTGTKRSRGEIYINKRYFAITGNVYDNHTEIKEANPNHIIDFLDYLNIKPDKKQNDVVNNQKSPQMTDDEILKKASSAKNGFYFDQLYNEVGKSGNSESDQSICNILAFYTQDIEQIRCILKNSPRYRDKFDEHPSYLDRTIQKAINDLTAVYNPNYNNGLQWDKEHIHVSAKGVESPLLSLSNLRILCEYENIKVKYNKMSHELELNGQRLEDRHDYMVKDITQKYKFKGATVSMVAGYLGALGYENSYHPVEDYLNTLEPLNSTCEFERLFKTITLKSIDDSDYAKKLLKKWLISCVAAIYDKEFTAQGSFTMQGTGGIFKSRWFSNLSPKKEWFKGELTGLDVNNKDSIAKAVKYWIVELAELESTLFKDFISLKGFMTSEHDEYRAAFDRRISIHKRRTAFCSSVNSQEFLKDDTGDRRFWIVEVDALDIETKINLDNLWAEIKYMYLSNEKHWLNRAETEEVKIRNRVYSVKTGLDDIFTELIDPDTQPQYYTSLMLKELLESYGYKEIGLTTTKISRTLSKLGYKSILTRRNNIQGRFYQLSIKPPKRITL